MYDCSESPPSEDSQTCADIIPCKCGKPVRKRQQPPNIQHELNVAKAILQESSTFSGDNLFDHLSEIIKRVLDERPPNVIDYFEELSRNIREQKFRMIDNYTEGIFDEPRCLRFALAVLNALNLLSYPTEEIELEFEELITEGHMLSNIERPLEFTKNVVLMEPYWQLCGISVPHEELFLLSCSIQKLLQHPAVESCSFWGKIFGREKSYYIVEATLVDSEIDKRMIQMKHEMQAKHAALKEELKPKFTFNPDLIPGTKWGHWPKEELNKMKIKQPLVPQPEVKIKFDIPPEVVGTGINRVTYFVCNALTDDWIELPIATPKQITTARLIRKYFTGNLEAEIISYPTFPGREKHLLRATIARITAANYVAPNDYYRKKRGGGGEEEEEEEEEEEMEEGDESSQNNDRLLVPNPKYKPLPISELMLLDNWKHVRPFILNQGRIVWFDEAKALKVFLRSLNKGEGEDEEEEEEEEIGEEGEEGDEEEKSQREIGRPLLTPCSEDSTTEYVPSWTTRISTHHNTANRAVIVKSNLWPGAYNIAMEKVVSHTYFGWGMKYVSRNYSPPHIPPIQEEYPLGPEIMEILDPSARQEEEWRLAHMKVAEKLQDIDEEGEEEDDDDEDKEKEETESD